MPLWPMDSFELKTWPTQEELATCPLPDPRDLAGGPVPGGAITRDDFLYQEPPLHGLANVPSPTLCSLFLLWVVLEALNLPFGSGWHGQHYCLGASCFMGLTCIRSWLFSC